MSKRMAALRQAQVEADGVVPLWIHWRRVLVKRPGSGVWRQMLADNGRARTLVEGGAEVQLIPTGGITVCKLVKGDEVVAHASFEFAPKAFDIFNAKGKRIGTRHVPVNYDKRVGRNASYGKAVKAYLAKQQPVSA